MAKPLSPRAGVALMLTMAAIMGANHVAARLSFDHGTSVATAVAARSGCVALAMLALLRLRGTPIALPLPVARRALLIGALVAVQSFCLYSAVSRIPVALALLAFNTYPLLFVLLSWAVDGERPPRQAVVAIPMALLGLALALDVVGNLDAVAGQLAQIGTGVAFALAASATFVMIMWLTNRWLKPVEARLRTLLTMGTTAVLVLLAGLSADGLSLPADATGWTGLVLLTLLYGTGITMVFSILPRLPSPSITVAGNFEPIAGLVLAWVVLGQAIGPIQLGGAALVVGAIVLLGLPRRGAPERLSSPAGHGPAPAPAHQAGEGGGQGSKRKSGGATAA